MLPCHRGHLLSFDDVFNEAVGSVVDALAVSPWVSMWHAGGAGKSSCDCRPTRLLHACLHHAPHHACLQVAEAEVAAGSRTPFSGPQTSHVPQKKGNPAAFGAFIVYKTAHASRWRDECVRDGNHKPNAAAMGQKASDAWSALSEEEKEPYKAEAKQRGASNAASKGGTLRVMLRLGIGAGP